MDLKIIGPIKSPLKEFDSVDEFNIYYHKHKDEMDTETTHSLNKKFKINGYRITKIKGVLCLKKIATMNPKKNRFSLTTSPCSVKSKPSAISKFLTAERKMQRRKKAHDQMR